LQGCLLIEVIFSVGRVVEAFLTHSISIKRYFSCMRSVSISPNHFAKNRESNAFFPMLG
jgi:hypothetical protein